MTIRSRWYKFITEPHKPSHPYLFQGSRNMTTVTVAPTRTQSLVYWAPAPSQRSLPSAVFVVDLDVLSLPRMTKTAAPASHGSLSYLSQIRQRAFWRKSVRRNLVGGQWSESRSVRITSQLPLDRMFWPQREERNWSALFCCLFLTCSNTME